METLNKIFNSILLETKALQRAKELHKHMLPSKLPLHTNITVRDNQELYLLLSNLELEGFRWKLNVGDLKPLAALSDVEKDHYGFKIRGWMKDQIFPIWIRLGNNKTIVSWNPDDVGDVYFDDLETPIEKKYNLYNSKWNIGTQTKIGIKTVGERTALIKFLKEYSFFHRHEEAYSGITDSVYKKINEIENFPFYIMLDLEKHIIVGYDECKDWDIDIELSDLEVK